MMSLRRHGLMAKRILQRVGRAWRYAIGTTSSGDASIISMDMEQVSGIYTCQTVHTDLVMEILGRDYVVDDDVAATVDHACYRVSRLDWDGEESPEALAAQWVVSLAAEAGTPLVELSSEDFADRESAGV